MKTQIMKVLKLWFALFLGIAAMSLPAISAPTRPLFHYQRNDTTVDKLTEVTINPVQFAAAPVHQNVFGNFIEHLGNVVNGGLWAQVLWNPNLERVESADTEPQGWSLSGAARWGEGGYLSPNAVHFTDGAGTLTQDVFLPTPRTRRYNGRLFLRGSGKLTISLVTQGKTLVQTTLTSIKDTWQEEKWQWELPANSLPAGQQAQVVVSRDAGSPSADQITLFPSDALDHFDPAVLHKAREWHIPLIRLSGNFSSGYHWQDGVGPLDARPTRRNAAWGGVEPNHFGTDEFLDYAHKLGAEPQIGINAGDGTPEEAAAWVRYVNGKRRRVSLWEIGNELYGGWQIGHTDAAGNADRYLKFHAAMLAVDPKLQIIATGKGEEFGADGITRNHTWNAALLKAAVANHAVPDYLSLHPLVPLPGGLDRFSYAERYESAMAHPTLLDDTLLPDVIRAITDAEGQNAKTRIAVTEWGIIVGGDRWWEGPNHDVLTGAIFNALTLNAMLRHSDWVTLANMTAFMHGGGIKKPRGVVIVDPQYYTQQLYAGAAPRWPVATNWTGPGQDVPARGYLPAVPNVSDVDVFSALSEDKSKLTIFLVNRHFSEPRPVQLTVPGFASATAQILTAAEPQARNDWDKPNAVRPQPFPVPPLTPGNSRRFTMPPHSLVVLTLAREVH